MISKNTPDKSCNATPADIFTPHDEPKQKPLGEPPDLPQGIVDPRNLPGPEILEPSPPGLPEPNPTPETDSASRA